MRTKANLKPEAIVSQVSDNKPPSSSSAQFEDCADSIEYLNSLTGLKFRKDTSSHTRLLMKLLDRGYSLDEIKAVIQFKVTEWSDVSVMKKYLRPVTLFDSANFKRYHEEVLAQNLQP